jgi:hypothetical protein
MFKAIIYEGIKVIEGIVVGSFSVHEWDCKAEYVIRKLENKASTSNLYPLTETSL